MADLSNVGDECSQAWRTSIDDIDDLGLLDYHTNQMGADPIAEEPKEGDLVHIEDDDEEVESDDSFVDRVFGVKNEVYDAYKSYALAKGFDSRKGKTTKSRMDQKIIGRQYLCNKKGHKKRDKILEV